MRLLHYTKNARSFIVSRRYNVQTAQYWGEIYQIFFLCDRYVKVLAIMQQSQYVSTVEKPFSRLLRNTKNRIKSPKDL